MTEYMDHLKRRYVEEDMSLEMFEQLMEQELARRMYDVPVTKNVHNEVGWL